MPPERLSPCPGIRITGKIKQAISTAAELVVTDQSHVYDGLGKQYRHDVINHIEAYVRGHIHTNTIENFWSLFKRGLLGSFHKVSIKHLGRYLDEFTYRFNNRETEALFAEVVIRLLIGTALTYPALTSGENA